MRIANFNHRKSQWNYAVSILNEHGIKPTNDKLTFGGTGRNIVIHSSKLANVLTIRPNMTNEQIKAYIEQQIEISKYNIGSKEEKVPIN